MAPHELRSPIRPAAFAALLITAAVLLAACGGRTGEGTTTTGPAVTIPEGAVIAEFETPDGERYRALLDGDAADNARLLFAGGEAPRIPNGLIHPGDGGVNLGHEWHVTDVEFADMAIEVCDGTVSYVDDLGYEGFVAQHGDRFCPWAAELVGLIEG